MYFRLAVGRRDPGSHWRQGVFQASFELLRSGSLEPYEADALWEVLDWFNENLPAPWEVSRRAAFWFRPGENRCSKRIWSLAGLLRVQGVHVQPLRARRPGYVEYEDDYQVAAVPFADMLR